MRAIGDRCPSTSVTVSGSGYWFKSFYAVSRAAAERTPVTMPLQMNCSKEPAALCGRFYSPALLPETQAADQRVRVSRSIPGRRGASVGVV
jgi:hypothetical protein